jgi:3-dehydroquinate synthetase
MTARCCTAKPSAPAWRSRSRTRPSSGFARAEDATRVRNHLAPRRLHHRSPQLPGAPHDADQLVALMAADKKAEAGKLTLILARAIGDAFVQKNADAEAVRAFLKEES